MRVHWCAICAIVFLTQFMLSSFVANIYHHMLSSTRNVAAKLCLEPTHGRSRQKRQHTNGRTKYKVLFNCLYSAPQLWCEFAFDGVRERRQRQETPSLSKSGFPTGMHTNCWANTIWGQLWSTRYNSAPRIHIKLHAECRLPAAQARLSWTFVSASVPALLWRPLGARSLDTVDISSSESFEANCRINSASAQARRLCSGFVPCSMLLVAVVNRATGATTRRRRVAAPVALTAQMTRRGRHTTATTNGNIIWILNYSTLLCAHTGASWRWESPANAITNPEMADNRFSTISTRFIPERYGNRRIGFGLTPTLMRCCRRHWLLLVMVVVAVVVCQPAYREIYTICGNV